MIWGGQLLHTRLGKPGVDVPIGESWEVWEGDPVESGPFAGVTLAEMSRRFPADLLGTLPSKSPPGRFPLLTKFIDAEQPLSVQVHPDDRQAGILEGQPNGKTEAWYILEAQPGAWIIHGLNQPIEAAELRPRLEAGTAGNLLRKVQAVAGETIFVPARTIHAIGPGIVLHEIQQTSDVTYRLYDWNRQSDDGKRELHLDKGLRVSSLAPSANPIVQPLSWDQGGVAVDLLLACDYFTVKRLTLPGSIEFDTRGQCFHIVTSISGSCTVTSSREVAGLETGQSILAPACLGHFRIDSTSDATVLVEYISNIRGDLVPELSARGIPIDRIESFLEQFGPPV